MRLRILLLAALPVPLVQLSAQTPRPEEIATFDRELPKLLTKYNVAGLGAAIIRDGRVVWTGGYGLQGPGTPVTDSTLFNVASMTKPVSAEIILRLVAAKRLSLDESMAPAWVDPDIANDPRHLKLTPRIMLSHQGGFANWRRMSPGGKLTFEFEPGTRFGYSGEGFNYVARFAEKKTGQTFEALADQYVFGPMRLQRMSFTSRPWMNGNVATPMDTTGKWGKPDLLPQGKWDAADDIYTTVRDYAAFLISVMSREGLPPELADERIGPLADLSSQWPCVAKPVELCPTHTGYALGWARFDYGKQSVVWHGGDDWGEHSMAYFYPDTRDGIIVMVNGGSGRFAVSDALDLLDQRSPIKAFADAHRSPVAVWLRALLDAAYAGAIREKKSGL